MTSAVWVVCTIWEYVYKNLIGAQFVPGSQTKLLRVAYRRYRGVPIELPDCHIRAGDHVAELHMSNLAIRRYHQAKSPEWAMYRDMVREFGLLSCKLSEGRREIKALWAITLMYPPAVRLGFVARQIPPGLWASVNYWWLRMLRGAYRPAGAIYSKELSTDRQPHEIWMSSQRFQERFSATADSRDVAAAHDRS